MKMYRKSDLTIIDGMLVNEATGDIVTPDHHIVRQANLLEDMNQKTAYLSDQPNYSPKPSLDGFKRKSIKDSQIEDVLFEAFTPIMDLEAAKSMAFMDELDDVNTTNAANSMLAEFADLLAFVSNDYVMDCMDCAAPFDTPTLGSVLKLTKKDVVAVVAASFGLVDDDDEEEVGHRRITSDEMTDEEVETLLNIIKSHDESVEGVIAISKDDQE